MGKEHAEVAAVPETAFQSLFMKIKRSLQYRGFAGTLGFLAWKIGNPSGEDDFDIKFGVNTRGIIELDTLAIDSPNVVHGVHYEETRLGDFAALMKHLAVKFEDFSFIDFGCGKGRVLLLAADYPFRQIIGVEFARELLDIAEQNLRNYRGTRQQCRNFALQHLDATQFEIPPERAVFYFYNPFDEIVMRQVLTNIQQSLQQQPREVFILYNNSLYRDLIPQFGFIEIAASRWFAVYQFNGQSHPETSGR